MRHPDDEAPEHVGDGGPEWLLAAGLVVVIVVALALLVGSVVGDELTELAPSRLLATWAAR
jgi:hypothetical protein